MLQLDKAYITTKSCQPYNFSTFISPTSIFIQEYLLDANTIYSNEDFDISKFYGNMTKEDEINYLKKPLMGENIQVDSYGMPLGDFSYLDYKIFRDRNTLSDNNLRATKFNDSTLEISGGSALIGGIYCEFETFKLPVSIENYILFRGDNNTESSDLFVVLCPKYFPLYDTNDTTYSFFERDNCFISGLIKAETWRNLIDNNEFNFVSVQGLFCILNRVILSDDVITDIEDTYSYDNNYYWYRRNHLYPYVKEEISIDENNNYVLDFGSA